MGEIVRDGVKVVQFFLSTDPHSYIYEVGFDRVGDIACTCQVWSSKGSCKHTQFVIERMEDDDYLSELVGEPTAEEIKEAAVSERAARNFIIKYGKIEAI